ncbi:DUF2267 domain-containing protein [Micromonospora sp. NPDC049559]|uniref:DUF2267 domain-containing protein n=1 Tax=Micromonospora sp. NPDC049559 TaxID=3155923 RepID=UPI003437D667
MVYDDFIGAVARRTGVSGTDAAAITEATLTTLADRISGGEAEDLAGALPDRLGAYLNKAPTREPAESFGLGEFVRRVTERAGVDDVAADGGLRAVFATLREAVAEHRFDDVVAQFPKDLREAAEPTGSRVGARRGPLR